MAVSFVPAAPALFNLLLMSYPIRAAIAALLLTSCTLPALAQDGKKPPKLVAPKEDPDRIYDAVSEPAIPVGGAEAFGIYLSDHLNYPTSALERRVQGTDSVEFIVEKNGTLSGLHVLQPVDQQLDEEALRVIKAGPKWNPGKHRGAVVRQRVVVPVTFALPAESAAAAATGGTTTEIKPVSPGAAPTGGPPSPTYPTASPAPPPSPGTVGSTTPSGLKVIQPESAASPPGGTDAFFAWIKQNQQYPVEARKFRREGKIRVEFMIETDGSLTNVKLLNRLGFGMDEEAVRLIKTAPKWTPAMYQAKPIRQKMVLPIIFQL